MTTKELATQFHDNHQQLVDYICSLPDNDFETAKNGKWSPGQQLDHVVRCIVPLAKALSNKPFIEAKFGKVQRPVASYEEVITNYKHALANGGKAPERFLPEPVDAGKKEALSAEMASTVAALIKSLESYSEEELDTLVIPHPLLGNLTVREFLALMAYHATHHREKTEENLKG